MSRIFRLECRNQGRLVSKIVLDSAALGGGAMVWILEGAVAPAGTAPDGGGGGGNPVGNGGGGADMVWLL